MKPDDTPSNKNIDLSHLSIYIFCIDGAVECFVHTTPSNGVNLIFKFSVIRHPRKKSHTRGKGRVASFLRMAPVQPFSRWQTAFLPLKSITLCVLTHTHTCPAVVPISSCTLRAKYPGTTPPVVCLNCLSGLKPPSTTFQPT